MPGLWEQHITAQTRHRLHSASYRNTNPDPVCCPCTCGSQGKNTYKFLPANNQSAVKSEGGSALLHLAWMPLAGSSWGRLRGTDSELCLGCSWLLSKIALLSYEPHTHSLQLLEGRLEAGPGVLLPAAQLAGGCAQTQKVILTVGISSDCSRQLL